MQRGDEIEPVDADYPFFAAAKFDRPGYPKLHFIEHNYAGDPTNWWVPNRAAVEAMLRSAGFAIVERGGGVRLPPPCRRVRPGRAACRLSCAGKDR